MASECRRHRRRVGRARCVGVLVSRTTRRVLRPQVLPRRFVFI